MLPERRLAQRVREARLKAGLSQAAAAGAWISPSHLCLIEQGKRGIRPGRLIYLAGRLGVTLSELLPEQLDVGYLHALLREGERLANSGDYTRAAAVYGVVLSRVPAGQPVLAARCRIRLGFALAKLHQYEHAKGYLDDGLRLAETTRIPSIIGLARNARGVIHLDRGEHDLAIVELREGLAALQRHRRPWPDLHGTILLNLGTALHYVARHTEALVYLDHAHRVAVARKDRLQLGFIARSAAGAHAALRQYDHARARLEEAADHFTAAERLDFVAAVENGLGYLFVETGDPEAAIPHFLRAVRLCEQIPDDLRRARNLTELARAHVLVGRHEEALPYAAEAIRLSQKVNDPLEAGRAEALRGEILLAERKLREAEAALRYAIPVFERHDQRKELIQAYAALGRVLNAQDRPAQASAALGQAVALARLRLPT